MTDADIIARLLYLQKHKQNLIKDRKHTRIKQSVRKQQRATTDLLIVQDEKHIHSCTSNLSKIYGEENVMKLLLTDDGKVQLEKQLKENGLWDVGND